MTRRIVVEPEAKSELLAARDWYADRRERLGQAFVEAADEALMRIAAMPSASTPVPGVAVGLGARRVFLKRFPYSVVFIDLGELLSVVAFAHLRRRPGYWMARVATPNS